LLRYFCPTTELLIH